MTCTTTAPATPEEWLGLIDRCATAAGGSDWPRLAVTGAAALALILAAALLVALARAARSSPGRLRVQRDRP